MAEAMGLDKPGGALISDVPDGPAKEAGSAGRRCDSSALTVSRSKDTRGLGASGRRNARSENRCVSLCIATAARKRFWSLWGVAKMRNAPKPVKKMETPDSDAAGRKR